MGILRIVKAILTGKEECKYYKKCKNKRVDSRYCTTTGGCKCGIFDNNEREKKKPDYKRKTQWQKFY